MTEAEAKDALIDSLQENAELRAGLSQVSGALVDDGTVKVGTTGRHYAFAIRQLTNRREAMQGVVEAVKEHYENGQTVVQKCTCRVCKAYRAYAALKSAE